MVPLSTIALGKTYHIEKIEIEDSKEQLYLASIGLTPKAVIRKIASAPFKDPTEYLVDHLQLVALSRVVAERILVSEIT